MSDASMPHCGKCNQPEYACTCNRNRNRCRHCGSEADRLLAGECFSTKDCEIRRLESEVETLSYRLRTARDAALEEAASAIAHFSCGCYKVIRKLKAKP
jgi:hypothetical protein